MVGTLTINAVGMPISRPITPDMQRLYHQSGYGHLEVQTDKGDIYLFSGPNLHAYNERGAVTRLPLVGESVTINPEDSDPFIQGKVLSSDQVASPDIVSRLALAGRTGIALSGGLVAARADTMTITRKVVTPGAVPYRSAAETRIIREPDPAGLQSARKMRGLVAATGIVSGVFNAMALHEAWRSGDRQATIGYGLATAGDALTVLSIAGKGGTMLAGTAVGSAVTFAGRLVATHGR